MIIHSIKATPVRKNGKWELVEEEFDEYIPDEKLRHNVFCSVCGFPDYPNCMSYCKCAIDVDDDDDIIVKEG